MNVRLTSREKWRREWADEEEEDERGSGGSSVSYLSYLHNISTFSSAESLEKRRHFEELGEKFCKGTKANVNTHEQRDEEHF